MRSIRFSIFRWAAAGLALAALPATAQVLPFSLPRQLSDAAPGGAPKVVGQPSGVGLAVWKRPLPDPTGTLVSHRISSSGGQAGDEVVVTSKAISFDLAGTPDERSLVVWNQTTAGANREIRLRRIGDNGHLLGNEVVVSGTQSRERFEPAVACGPAQCLVAWWEKSGNATRLIGRFVTPLGAVVGDVVTLLGSGGLAVPLQIAISHTGEIAAAWTDLSLAGTPYFATFNPSGSALGPQSVLDSSTVTLPGGTTRAAVSSKTRVAWNEAGQLLAVWDRLPLGTTSGTIRGRLFNAQGNALGDVRTLNEIFGAANPSLAWSDDQDHFAVTWETQRLGAGNTPKTGIVLRILGADGAPAGFELNAVERSRYANVWSAVGFAGPLGLLTVWSSEQEGRPTSRKIEVLKWRPDEPTCIPPFQPQPDLVSCAELGPAKRFLAYASFRQVDGLYNRATANAVTRDAGFFFFNSLSNPELIAKIVDGRALNNHFWFFFGALSNQEYSVAVLDRTTGLTRVYYNAAGTLASQGDTRAFPVAVSGLLDEREGDALEIAVGPADELAARTASSAGKAVTACAAGAELCLNNDSFGIELEWEDTQGNVEFAHGVEVANDGGYFWFRNPANVEIALKILDGRPINGKYWVFFASLTNVRFTLRIRDSQGTLVKEYANPPGEFKSVADTAAFP